MQGLRNQHGKSPKNKVIISLIGGLGGLLRKVKAFWKFLCSFKLCKMHFPVIFQPVLLLLLVLLYHWVVSPFSLNGYSLSVSKLEFRRFWGLSHCLIAHSFTALLAQQQANGSPAWHRRFQDPAKGLAEEDMISNKESREYFEARETRIASYLRFRKLRNELCLRYVIKNKMLTNNLLWGVPNHMKLSMSETKPMIFFYQNMIFLLGSFVQWMNSPAVHPVSWAWNLEGSHRWPLPPTCPTCYQCWGHLLGLVPHLTISCPFTSHWCSGHHHGSLTCTSSHLVPRLQDCSPPARFLIRAAHRVCHEGVKVSLRWPASQSPTWPGRAHCIHPSVLHKYPLSACVSKREEVEALGYTVSSVYSETAGRSDLGFSPTQTWAM